MPLPPLPRRLAATIALAACALGPAAAAHASTVIVDDDRAQCPNAAFTSLQAAVDAAISYDTIAICPGTYAEAAPAFEPFTGVTGASNGLLIRKNLTLKGAGADKVLIKPAATTALGGTGASALLDGAGNVVTVARQTLGSTDEEDISVNFSGLTIASPSVDVDAGIVFVDTSGSVTDSVVGPLRNATSGAALGWGIVAANDYLGTNPPNPGAPKRRVIVHGSAVTGYGAGGIRIDGATQSAPNTRSGIAEISQISDTVVDGGPTPAAGTRSGIEFHAGARGSVTTTRLADNQSSAGPRSAVGLLLTDADIDNLLVGRSSFGPNGFGVYNANADNTAVRTGARLTVTESYFGPGGPIQNDSATESPSTPTRDAVSGRDSAGSASVAASPHSTEPRPDVRSAGAVNPGDAAPTVSVTDPIAGASIPAGSGFSIAAAVGDDFDVASVRAFIDSVPVGADTTPPYRLSATMPAGTEGTTQAVTVVATDSTGQTAADTVSVAVPPAPAPPAAPAPAPTPTVVASAPTLGRPLGLPKGQITSAKGFRITAQATNTTKLTVKLGSKTICTDTSRPFTCSYIPRTADVGTRTITLIAEGPGGSVARTAAVKIKRLTGAKVSLSARRSGRTTIVTGRVLRPKRLLRKDSCPGARVQLRLGSARRTVRLTSTCRLPTTRITARGTRVRGRYYGTDRVDASRAVSVKIRS